MSADESELDDTLDEFGDLFDFDREDESEDELEDEDPWYLCSLCGWVGDVPDYDGDCMVCPGCGGTTLEPLDE